MYLVTRGINYEGESPDKVLEAEQEAIDYTRLKINDDEDWADYYIVYTIPELKSVFTISVERDYSDGHNNLPKTTVKEHRPL